MSANGQALPEMVVAPPGPRSRELSARLSAVESPAFDARRVARAKTSGEAQSAIVYERGLGANVWDADGNRYVDLVAGFGALPLGHGAPEIADALRVQGEKLTLALGDVYGSDSKVALCEELAALFPAPGARVLLGLSGADAVTAALKTAMLVTGKPGVIAFRGAYHGLSYGPLAACGYSESFRSPFAPQLGVPVTFVQYPVDAATLDDAMVHLETTLVSGTVGAVLVEPILGRGGCVLPPPELLLRLRTLCDRAGALLIVDEIWTGLGRSGAWLASQEAGIVPDLLCIGKALGGGLPVSACLGTKEVMAAWGAHGGSAIHTATHFGFPLACATALATLKAIREGDLPVRARYVGSRFLGSLETGTAGLGVRNVRGKGLLVGIELEGGAARALAVSRKLLLRGYIVLTGGVAGDVLTLTPPLRIEEDLLTAFGQALSDVLRTSA